MSADPFSTHTGNLVLAQARITHSGVSTLYYWYGIQDSTTGIVLRLNDEALRSFVL